MNRFNLNIPSLLQTTRGIIPIDNIHIGDVVYEYKTGNEFSIENIIDSKIENIYRIKYNDGRILYSRESELSSYKNINTTPHPMEYNKNKIINPLFPDPYIAGALLIYGDADDEYLNLPFDCDAVNNLFSHKYQLNYADRLSVTGKAYFRYNGNNGDDLITWKEFFPNNYTFFAKYKNDEHPLIPLEYQRSSIKDRIQFIRGVFDCGYKKNVFPYNCGIIHWNESNLLEVQKMLWSIGILSILSYNTNVPKKYEGRNYRLEIVGKYDGYPGFFYDIDTLERMIINDTHEQNKFNLKIESIEWYTKTYMKNIVLSKPSIQYLIDNFLPRISEYV